MAMKSLTAPKSKLRCIQKLGGGTYGKVYAAISQENELLAVKRILIPLIYSGTVTSVRELNILMEVIGHPFCLQLKDVHYSPPFESELTPTFQHTATDKLFFVMEKGDMDGLRFIRDKSVGWVDRKLFMVHLTLAIEFLHSRSIYHRDIKPANVICFLRSDGSLQAAKLTDYGLSQYYTSQVLAPPDMVTLWYRAPEISLRKEYDMKIDVWSLGCILFELVSGNNLVRPETDEQLLNSLISMFPFPREDYILARQLMGTAIIHGFDQAQANLINLRTRLGLPEYEIASFNSNRLGGRLNFGKYDDYLALLSGCLSVDPKNRFTISQCLNQPFFDGFRDIIDQTRTKFGINSEGEWIFRPKPTFSYRSGSCRSLGMKWFGIIYSERMNYPICSWYSHRIFFHALEMFDRFILSCDTNSEGIVLIWVNTFLFISAKFFRVMQTNIGIDIFANGITDLNSFRDYAIRFEETVIRDVFQGRLYSPTIYEEAPEYLTEAAVKKLLEVFLYEQVASGTSFNEIWAKYSSEIWTNNLSSLPASLLPTITI